MYLSLCLIVKNENNYLQEWIDYHILLGVEHFWIYDNESTIPVENTLKTYIQSGWVTVHHIEGRVVQMYAYDHCIQTYGRLSKWIGFLDTDEFIVPHTPNLLSTYLRDFEQYGGFAISSLFFGDNGHKHSPPAGQIAGYRKRTPERFSRNRFVKMIVQPEKVIYPISPHSFVFKEGAYCVNEKKLRVDAQEFPCHADSIHINHYFTRSEEEWKIKMARGGGAGIQYSEDHWANVNRFSTVEDNRAIELIKSIIQNHYREHLPASDDFEGDLPQILHEVAAHVPVPELPSIENENQNDIHPRQELVDYFRTSEQGISFLNSGQLMEARQFYANEISRFPFDVTRYTNFAAVCIQMGDLQTAWPALAEAWRISPKSLYVLLCMTDYFYAIGNFAQAEKTSLLAASQGDLEPNAIAILALSQWKQGKIKEAISSAEPLMKYADQRINKNPYISEILSLINQTN